MTATQQPTQNGNAHKTKLDISQLILQASFLSDKEKYMWIKITKRLNDVQLKKLADIFLDEANKRRILENNLEKTEDINKKYLRDLQTLNSKYGTTEVHTNKRIGSTEATRRMLDELGNA